MTRFLGKMLPKHPPLKLLYEHALLTSEAAGYIPQATKDHFDGKDVSQISLKVDELEDKADELKILIREEYSKLKFVYFDKTEMLIIVHELDATMDSIDDYLKLLTINKVEKPLSEEMIKLFLELAEETTESVKNMVKAVEELLNFVELSFSKSVASHENMIVSKVESEESQTDKLSLEIGKKLFSSKNEIHPIDWFYIEKLVRLLTRIADHSENVAERIRMITHF
ncbi:DUF47 domain-containing protein [Pseudothermotoga thermarum]|uniref:Putative phosphate transport regulator n=1 Tax=Pseudothermotoga thermarum DSM 5069 TaxID=688269 RepID=F7YY32_9THEM|nr:DUF47 family protein [Pseudothermotoga thermarum]AEH50842.1 putative phosphate transport regulator [Pseudothermotoga thermarum DSM 5069]